MKIIYRYLFKEILLITGATVGVLTILLVLFNVFKDVFDLLLNSDVPLLVIFKLVGLLIPFVLTYTLPWGLLLAVLLVFGRMSHDQELMALKSSGMGLAPVIAPAIWLALGFSLFSFWINAYVAPESRSEFKNIGNELVNSNPMAFFTTQKPIDKFQGYRIYIGKKQGTTVEDVHIWQVDENFTPVRSLRADRAEVRPDLDGKRILLTLYNARQEERDVKNPRDITKVRAGFRAVELPLEISLAQLFEKVKGKKSLGGLTIWQIGQEVLNPTETPQGGSFTPFLTEIQKRVALALSCFTFTLVGIPLAIQTQRRETSIGVALSLAVAVAYYFIIFLAETLKKNANVFPELIIWAPNLIFQALGFYLIWRMNKK